MTVSTTTNRISYAGNDSTTAFATGFKFFANGDLTVTLVTDSTGAEAVKVLDTDFSVAGAGLDAGGTVTMNVAPATGETLVIERTQAYTQGLDLVENDPFPSESVEETLDKIVIMTQQNNSLIDRSLRQPDGDTADIDRLPAKVTRATKVLGFDSDGDPVASTLTLTAIEESQTNAAASAAAASASETSAAASATLASQWATKTDGQVASTDYSSKAWAIGGTGVTDTASAGAAKEWATAAEDDLVDGSEYSAKHYSAKASASATNAAASEAAAAAAAQGWSDVVSITAGTTNIETTDANKYYILDASGGSITMNLPAVGTSDGLTLAFEVLDASNSITIARDGTDTINGSAADYTSLTGVGDVVHFISIDGTPDNWSARLISRFVVDGSTITQSGRTISVGTGGVDTTQLADDAVDPTKAIAGRNAQTGTTYTLALADNLKTVSLSNASAVAVTIPTNASIAFTANETRIDLVNIGAGEVTVSGDTGVTVNGVSAGSFTLAQYAGASLLKIDTNTWLAPNSTVA